MSIEVGSTPVSCSTIAFSHTHMFFKKVFFDDVGNSPNFSMFPIFPGADLLQYFWMALERNHKL